MKTVLKTLRDVDASELTSGLGRSIRELFGRYCSGEKFLYDKMTEEWVAGHKTTPAKEACSQSTATSEIMAITEVQMGVIVGEPGEVVAPAAADVANASPERTRLESPSLSQRKRDLDEFREDDVVLVEDRPGEEVSQLSNVSVLTERAFERRRDAFDAAILNTQRGVWAPIGLISTSDNHSVREAELDGG